MVLEPEPEVLEETPIEDGETQSEEPISPPKNPKATAKAMLKAGKDPDEIAEATSLSIRVIWGLKGAMERATKKRKREEQARMKEDLPSEEDYEDEDEESSEEGDEGEPFRRGKKPSQIISEILKKYRVPKRAIDIITDRCERVPNKTLHPSDLERLLLGLRTKLKPSEAIFVSEEYDLALRQQRQEEEDLQTRRPYYDRGGTIRPPRRGMYYQEEERRERYPESRHEREEYPQYDSYGRRVPERESESNAVSFEDFESFKEDMLETLRKEKEQDKFDKLFETIAKQKEETTKLTMELKNIKENPPTAVVADKGESDHEKSLKHTIDRQDKKLEEWVSVIREERKEHKADLESQRKERKDDIEELRKFYKEKVEEVKEEGEKRYKEKKTADGYSDDAIRLAADGLERVATLAAGRKPVEKILKVLAEGSEKAPTRERAGKSKIAELVGPEYQE